MNIKYTIPSKTFLVGEYAVLFGCDALLIATKPLFDVSVDTDKISDNSDMLDFSKRREDVSFASSCDGFGKSSAGFLSIYQSIYKNADIKEIVNFYKSISSSSIKPSCADIVTQIIGGITFFNGNSVEDSSQLDWCFDDVEIMIFKTNTKISTYKHLSNSINLRNLELMRRIVKKTKSAIVTKSAEKLSTAIHDYYYALLEENLVIESTKKLIEKIVVIDGVLAAKGCGALCADVIITLNYREASASIRENLDFLGLSYISSTNDLVGGINVVC